MYDGKKKIKLLAEFHRNSKMYIFLKKMFAGVSNVFFSLMKKTQTTMADQSHDISHFGSWRHK